MDGTKGDDLGAECSRPCHEESICARVRLESLTYLIGRASNYESWTKVPHLQAISAFFAKVWRRRGEDLGGAHTRLRIFDESATSSSDFGFFCEGVAAAGAASSGRTHNFAHLRRKGLIFE